MKQVTAAEFMAKFDSEVHEAIRDSLRSLKSDAVVCFENVDMCSSRLGERTALGVGPNNTYKTVEECDGKWLNDLPSMRQYPQVWCLVNLIIK